VAWQKLGETAKARAAFHAELARDPGDARSIEALQALDRGAGR
jgi:hypothetical protein